MGGVSQDDGHPGIEEKPALAALLAALASGDATTAGDADVKRRLASYAGWGIPIIRRSRVQVPSALLVALEDAPAKMDALRPRATCLPTLADAENSDHPITKNSSKVTPSIERNCHSTSLSVAYFLSVGFPQIWEVLRCDHRAVGCHQRHH